MSARAADGHTLIELLAVLAVLGIIAMIARGGPAPSAHPLLLARTAEVASALRFARDEAVRTGRPLRVHLLSDRVRVELLDASADPPTVVGIASHPVRHQPWETVLATAPTPDLTIDETPFVFADGARSSAIDFHPDGWPMRRQEAGRQVPLDRSEAILRLRGLQAAISIDPLTGTVRQP